jgi:preprotein translocase subunit YajC
MFSIFNILFTAGGVDAGTAVTAAPGTAAVAGDAAANASDAGAAAGFNPVMMIVIWAAVIGVFYFFSIRPQSKRDKKIKEMQASMRVGDNVLTTSGLYGKIADIGDDCFVVEFGTNRGVRVPVRKTDIVAIKEPNLTLTHAASEEKK